MQTVKYAESDGTTALARVVQWQDDAAAVVAGMQNVADKTRACSCSHLQACTSSYMQFMHALLMVPLHVKEEMALTCRALCDSLDVLWLKQRQHAAAAVVVAAGMQNVAVVNRACKYCAI